MTALARGVQVLQCFSMVDQELTSRDLMARTGLPRPTIFRITTTLRQLGLLRYSDTRSAFTLGLRMLTMAAPVLAGMTLRQLARPMMQALADYAEGQVLMAVGEGHELAVVEVAQGANSTVFRIEIGSRLSLARTVSGRAFLLTLSGDERTAYVEDIATVDAGRAERLLTKLEATAADLQSKGYAYDTSEYVRELSGVAAPMRTAVDTRGVVFSCSIPSYSASEERLDDIGRRLAGLVRNVEASLGHLGAMSGPAFHDSFPARTPRRKRSSGAP